MDVGHVREGVIGPVLVHNLECVGLGVGEHGAILHRRRDRQVVQVHRQGARHVHRDQVDVRAGLDVL